MNYFRLYTNIKLGLFFIALFLIFGLLTYSNSIVDQLRKDNRQIVTIYSQIIAKTVNEDNDDNLNFVFDEIIKKIQSISDSRTMIIKIYGINGVN